MDRCSLDEAAAKMYGRIKAVKDPAFNDKFKTWGESYHAEKGAASVIAQKVAKEAGRTIPGKLFGTADEHNPLVGRLLAKSPVKPTEAGNHLVFGFLTPKESVAPQILDEMRGHWKDYKTYISPDADTVKTYKAQVAKHAERLHAEIADKPQDHGIKESNRYATEHFLELMKNGWPEFDFTVPAEGIQADSSLKAIQGKLMGSHVLFNPMIYMFHGFELPVRMVSMYPQESAAVLNSLNGDILKGQPIPEAQKAGIYTKLPDDGPLLEDGNWSKNATGIPLCQTISESMAWLLHQEGVPLKDALQNVALSHLDPFEQQFMLTRPDHSNMQAFIRYSMIQNAWYANLAKRALSFSGEDSQKAWTALGLYSAQKAAVFGFKAAIPFAGAIGMIPGVGQAMNQTAQAIDDHSPLNLVKKATGIDLGENESPMQTWAMPFYPIKLLLDSGKINVSDSQAIGKEMLKGQYGKAGLTGLHLLATDYNLLAALVQKAPVVPNEALKTLRAYTQTVDNASGGGHDFWANLVGAHLGKEAQKEFVEAHK